MGQAHASRPLDMVEDHVSEEEEEVFPRLLEQVEERDWVELFDRMIERRHLRPACDRVCARFGRGKGRPKKQDAEAA